MPLLPLAFGQQAPAPEKCVFAGMVLDAVTGQPVARANVSLRFTTPGKGTYVTVTDSAGAFRFEAVEAGDYAVSASESEHTMTGAMFLKPGQATSVLHFTAGQSITGAVARLDPWAVITAT